MEEKIKYEYIANYFVNINVSDLDKPIYKIIPMNRLLDMLRDNELILVNIKLWEDVYENFFLKSKFKFEDEEFDIESDSDHYFGQSWSFEKDSDALWRIYSPDKQSVRIKTSLKILFNTIIETYDDENNYGFIFDRLIGAVSYKSKPELEDWIKEQTIKRENIQPNIEESLFLKRDNFKHEKEVRAIYFPDKDDAKIKPNSNSQLVSFKIDALHFIDEITFDPRAESSFVVAYTEY